MAVRVVGIAPQVLDHLSDDEQWKSEMVSDLSHAVESSFSDDAPYDDAIANSGDNGSQEFIDASEVARERQSGKDPRWCRVS